MRFDLPPILTLDQLAATDLPRAGAKACNLALMRQSGLPIPGGFVVCADAVDPEQPVFDPVLRNAVADAYTALGEDVAVAVRSSAIGEDGAAASFAGQFLSRMPVRGLEALLEAIAACWASRTSTASATYAGLRGQQKPPGIAVLVQRYIPADAAGVLFTADPLTGAENTFVIEATRGPGAPLVEGAIRSDRYHIAREQGALRECNVAHPDQPPVLAAAHLGSLAAYGDWIEALFGAPQDIEWVLANDQIALLQARPITALHIRAAGIWTSANFREVLPGIVSPFTFSIVLERSFAEGTTRLFRELGLAGPGEPVMEVRRFFGHAYWRVDHSLRLQQRLPGFSEQQHNTTVGIATRSGIPPTPVTPSTLLRGIRVLRNIQRLYHSFPAQSAAFIARFWQQPHVRRQTLAHAPDQEVDGWVRLVIERHEQVTRMIDLCAMLCIQAQNDFQAALQAFNRHLPDDQQISDWKLLTGLGDLPTAQPLLLLWEIAQAASWYPGVAALIRDTAPVDLPDALQSSAAGRDFWRGLLAGYLERFAWQAVFGADVTSPLWEEQPEQPLALLRAMVSDPATGDFYEKVLSQASIHTAERARLNRYRWRYPWLVAPILRNLRLLRRFTAERERLRICVGVAYADARCALLEQGRRWAGILLKSPDDLFWLEAHEILAALDGGREGDTLRSRVAARRALAWRYRHFQPPPVIGEARLLEQPAHAQLLQGIACGAGTAEGLARVVHSPQEADKIRPGEILVAPATNPSWAAVFGLVRAIVTEEGGLLSHTSVIARECGIPMVVQVPHATHRIQTGQRLRVDSQSGRVFVL
ncbi:MAG TPA: PEP/pyruvate-binding domain-containing protein [Roseiflexaceae bacterium]|nr:PEP/pyruvate-binding domain-containing protein [Roseiflexaceae bacterium]